VLALHGLQLAGDNPGFLELWKRLSWPLDQIGISSNSEFDSLHANEVFDKFIRIIGDGTETKLLNPVLEE
jgi:hypothetical protein